MKPAVIIPPRHRRDRLFARLAVGAVLVSGVVIGHESATQGCGGNAYPASVGWNGSDYGVAWAEPELGAVAVYAHRFDNDENDRRLVIKRNRRRTFVHRVRRLESAPEIVGNDSGFIVFVHAGDGEPYGSKLVAVSLDRDGRVRGPAQVIGHHVYSLCKSPTWNGRTFSFAYTERYVDGTRTYWKLTIGELNEQGDYMDSKTYQIDRGAQCSVAQDERGGVAVSYAAYDATFGPLRLRRYGEQWAKLYLADLDDRTLAVDIVRQDGLVSETIPLPERVRAVTADLGVNDNGLFVTWIAKGKLHVLPVGASEESIRHRVASDARGTRALGHGDRCAVVWTVGDGDSVRLAVAQPCN